VGAWVGRMGLDIHIYLDLQPPASVVLVSERASTKLQGQREAGRWNQQPGQFLQVPNKRELF